MPRTAAAEFQFTRLLRDATSGQLRGALRFLFQFTRLLRGATSSVRRSHPDSLCFNSRASCEARRPGTGACSRRSCFNSRAFCEARRARPRASDHLPRSFNSRASCEARPSRNGISRRATRFQFTRLLRGATGVVRRIAAVGRVSIHAPLARRDACRAGAQGERQSFNSRASCEARPTSARRCSTASGFNSRASCEARRAPPAISSAAVAFQFTRLLRGATRTSSE